MNDKESEFVCASVCVCVCDWFAFEKNAGKTVIILSGYKQRVSKCKQSMECFRYWLKPTWNSRDSANKEYFEERERERDAELPCVNWRVKWTKEVKFFRFCCRACRYCLLASSSFEKETIGGRSRFLRRVLLVVLFCFLGRALAKEPRDKATAIFAGRDRDWRGSIQETRILIGTDDNSHPKQETKAKPEKFEFFFSFLSKFADHSHKRYVVEVEIDAMMMDRHSCSDDKTTTMFGFDKYIHTLSKHVG